MNLKDLKAAALSKMTAIPEEVMSYVTGLEGRLGQNKFWAAGGFVAGVICTILVRYLIK